MRNRILKKCSILMLIAVIASTSLMNTCYAAATTSKTVKEVSTLSMNPTKINKKAAKIKVGTTNLKFSKGYIKFTAPKKGTYQFSFSNLSGDVASAGFFFYKVKTSGSTKLLKAKNVYTEGGKTYIIRICHKDATDKYYDTASSSSSSSSKKVKIPTTITAKTYLPSRTAKLTLKKNQTIYIYAEYFQYIENSDNWGNVSVTVKKVES